MKLRTRIFLLCALVALIPMITITVVAYSRYMSTTYDRMDDISSNVYDNAVTELEKTITGIEQSVGLFTFYSDSDYSIIDILKPFADPQYKPDNYTILEANNSMKFVAQNIFYSYAYINGIYVFTPSGAVFNHTNGQNSDMVYNYQPGEDGWYKETIALDGKMYISPIQDQQWISGDKKSIVFARALYDVYSHQFLGVLAFDCSSSIFDLSTANPMPDIAKFKLENTENGSVLYNSSESSTMNTDSIRDSVLSLQNLRLTASFDYGELIKEFNFTGFLLLFMAIGSAILILLLSYFVAKSITYPIEHLGRKMAAQNGSHLSLSGQFLNRSDEIGTLYNEYNNMVEELNASIKEDYQDKLITMDAQMRSLEAQINSHFLFNTLESINSLAELDDDEQISTMVLALGNMFRYSIKTKSELVPLSDEIKHVNDYISIQKIRFDHKFSVDINVTESLMNNKVLKLILQPLVENALYHGLNYCASGDHISIEVRGNDSALDMDVSDNGVGMTLEELYELRRRLGEESSFTELGHRSGQSIGLKNIQSRIELYYGKGYGIHIDSTEGKGTMISIHIPVI